MRTTGGPTALPDAAAGPSPRAGGVELSDLEHEACHGLVRRTARRSRREVAALRAALEADLDRHSRRPTPGRVMAVMAATPIALAVLAQIATTVWIALGSRTTGTTGMSETTRTTWTAGTTRALQELSHVRFFRLQPAGIVDDLWNSWLAGDVVPRIGDGPRGMSWPAPEAVHGLAVVAGCAALTLTAWIVVRHLRRTGPVPAPARWGAAASCAVWAVGSMQFLAAGATVLAWVLAAAALIGYLPFGLRRSRP